MKLISTLDDFYALLYFYLNVRIYHQVPWHKASSSYCLSVFDHFARVALKGLALADPGKIEFFENAFNYKQFGTNTV